MKKIALTLVTFIILIVSGSCTGSQETDKPSKTEQPSPSAYEYRSPEPSHTTYIIPSPKIPVHEEVYTVENTTNAFIEYYNWRTWTDLDLFRHHYEQKITKRFAIYGNRAMKRFSLIEFRALIHERL